MRLLRPLLLAAATSIVAGAPASQAANWAATTLTRPVLLAQAGDQIATAEAALEDARAAYRGALVAGQNRRIQATRRDLDEAIDVLNVALAAAGQTPFDGERAIAMDEAAAADRIVEDARAELRDVMAKGRQSDINRARKRLQEAVAELDKARAALGLEPGEPLEELAIAQPPAPETPPPVADAPAVAELPAMGVAPPTLQLPPPPAVATLPPPPALPPPAPPLLAPREPGQAPPRFGDIAPGDRPVELPKTEAAVREGEAIEAEAGRVIVKEGGQVTIKHDDSERLRDEGSQTQVVSGRDATETTTVTRRNGVQVVTVRDRDGNILQRYRKNRDGSIEMLIGEAPSTAKPTSPPPPPKINVAQLALEFLKQLPPVAPSIPQQDYIVQSSIASQGQLEQALIAPPVEQVERAYSLEEIRRSGRLRDKVRRIDFDTVTFETGSAIVPPGEIPRMQRIGAAIQATVHRDPSQVVLIEGHTDAVGSDLSNLALSDRRAETVAQILTYYYGIPPENLVTQGYGEQYLKIPTVRAERQNRRVAFRNITWLMRAGR